MALQGVCNYCTFQNPGNIQILYNAVGEYVSVWELEHGDSQIWSRELKEQQRCDWHMELLALPSAPGHLLFSILSLNIQFEGLYCAAKLTLRISFKGFVFI